MVDRHVEMFDAPTTPRPETSAEKGTQAAMAI